MAGRGSAAQGGGTAAANEAPEARGPATASRRRRFAPSLQARLYALVLLALLPVIVLQAWNARAALEGRETDAQAEVLRLAESIAREIDAIIQTKHAVMRTLAQTPTVRDRAQGACDAFLTDVARGSGELGFVVMDADGNAVCSSIPSARGLNYADRPYFEQARATGGFTLGAYSIGRASGLGTLPAALPLVDAAGRFDGVIAGGLDVASLAGRFAGGNLPDGGALNILDRDGTVLVRLPPLEGAVGSRAHPEVLDLLARPGPGTGFLTNREGRDVIFGYVPVARAPEGLFVTVSLGRDALMAGYRTAARRNLWILGGGLAFGFAVAALGWRLSVSPPLERLAGALERWRDGDLDARAGLGGDAAELARLGALFDGMAGTMEQRTAELAAERERLGLVADAMPALVAFIDRDERYQFVNRAYELWFGRPGAEIVGRRVREVLEPDSYEKVRDRVDAVLAGRPQAFEDRLRYRQKGLRHVSVQYVPALRDGAVEGFYAFVEDTTEAQRSQALRAAQMQALELAIGGAELRGTLGALAEAAAGLFDAAAAVFLLDADGQTLRLFGSARVAEAFAREVAALPVGPDMPGCGAAAFTGMRVVTPDVGEAAAWEAYRAVARANGVAACWSTPIRQFGGPVLGTFAVYAPEPRAPRAEDLEAIDALVQSAAVLIDRKRGEDHQRLLMAELNHRVKNTLAVVQSVATQSLRDAADLETGLETFTARLRALAATHDVLTAEAWTSADLRQLIERGLGALDAGLDRCDIDGPPVRLSARLAVSASMALHELATNALKYGALAVPDGRVEIRWRLDGAGAARRLRFVWRERGGPPVEPPARRGFGTRMLERALPAEAGGTARLDYAPEGLAYELDAPLPAPAAEPPAAAASTRAEAGRSPGSGTG